MYDLKELRTNCGFTQKQATAWTASGSYYVRGVYTSGALSDGNACDGNSGVRPLCNLNSSILVDVTDMDKLVSKKDEMTSALLKTGECYVNITKNEEENP